LLAQNIKKNMFAFFWTVLFLDAWDILIAEQPSLEEWHISI
jgi:hypothetical protein